VHCPLILEDCHFDESPDLYWAKLGFTSLRGCVLPGLIGSNVKIDGHLRLNRCTVTGELKLLGARIAGGLLLDAAHVSNPGNMSINGERLEVAGDILLKNGFVSVGQIRLSNARIGGSVNLEQARLSAPGGLALSAEKIHIQGGLYGRDAQFDGEVRLRRATVNGALTLSAARFRNASGVTLRGDRLTADTGVFLRDGMTSDGEIRLSYAHVGRNLVLADANLRNSAGNALTAEGASIEGTVDARGLRSDGGIDFSDAHVTGSVHFEGAHLANAGGPALQANGIHVGAVLNLCDGFTAHGKVALTSAHIESRLCFDGATLMAPGGEALKCWRIRTSELALRTLKRIHGTVNLQHARVSILHDNPDLWPDELQLNGLTYEALDPLLPAVQRLAWLARDPGGYLPGPYEQLSSGYRNLGHDKDARTVLLAKQRCRRTVLPWYAKAWGYVQDITVGYGYRPARAALWLLALLALGTTSFAWHHPPPYHHTEVPPFNPLIYTLNLLLPIIDFGQEHAYNPQGIQQWLAYLLIASGWILATTAAAGVIRALRRD
jgi:hypothetical protein